MSMREQIPKQPGAAPVRQAPKPARSAVVQQKAAAGGPAASAAESPGGEKQEKALLPRDSAAENGPGKLPPTVNEALRSPGQPLEAATRRLFEPRFGHDFSKVRVHADSAAAESARTVGAFAYTVGNELVFAQDQYKPGTGVGQALIAHELAHTVQQQNRKQDSAQEDVALERDADTAAASALLN
jgi:hypothetical protein